MLLQWGQYLLDRTVTHNAGVGISLNVTLPTAYSRNYTCFVTARNTCEFALGASLTNMTNIVLGYTNHSSIDRYIYSIMWFTI